MRSFPRSSLHLLRVAAFAALGLIGCTETVYKDFPGFAPPPSGAGEYLGYTSGSGPAARCAATATRATRRSGLTAKHSKAWANLQASGHAAPECGVCHSVSTLGNDTGAARFGYQGSPSERYQDVQCEACHGPGQNHVENAEVDREPAHPIDLRGGGTEFELQRMPHRRAPAVRGGVVAVGARDRAALREWRRQHVVPAMPYGAGGAHGHDGRHEHRVQGDQQPAHDAGAERRAHDRVRGVSRSARQPEPWPDAFPGGHGGCGHESLRALSQPAVGARSERQQGSARAGRSAPHRQQRCGLAAAEHDAGQHPRVARRYAGELEALCHVPHLQEPEHRFVGHHVLLDGPSVPRDPVRRCEREAAADRLRGGEPHVQRVRDLPRRRARSRRA